MDMLETEQEASKGERTEKPGLTGQMGLTVSLHCLQGFGNPMFGPKRLSLPPAA